MEIIKVLSRNEAPEENSERFERFSEQVKYISTKVDEIKEKYGVKDSVMHSFSPDLLPTHELPMVLSQEVFDDYQRILSQTNNDNKEHSFIWLGKKIFRNGQEHYLIEKAIAVPEDTNDLHQSKASRWSKFNIYSDSSLHDGYDVIVDGHSHPKQNTYYADFSKMPPRLLEELSLKGPGENFSIADLNNYATLLSVTLKNIKDKTIIGAVITYTGDLLNVALDKDSPTTPPTTIRQIGAIVQDQVLNLPTSNFNKEKSEQFFNASKIS